MKFDDMGPGPLPAPPIVSARRGFSSPDFEQGAKSEHDTTEETDNGHAIRNDGGRDCGSPAVRPESVSTGVVHPDLIEAAIRMLVDQGYRVFRARDLKKISASYAVRPGMLTHPDFDQFIRDRVLQDLSINVAMSPGVRWRVKDGSWGRLHEAKMLVVVAAETDP